ncbi:SOCS box domain-containing protein [Caerostris darwini]|uniref:SOCS box domain-containing protein n=1 Tax=Caerostris darwini TaxID=1538125 RepID=A0AAV4P0A5_9ARAC|nr:SOCS box domain-containing protein [Caerostris darwini]
MEILFTGEIQYRIIELRTAWEVALHSSIVHSSLDYLDFSTQIFTQEGFRKFHNSWREILYRFHLDLPKGLETNLKKEFARDLPKCFAEMSNENALHLEGFYVEYDLYSINLARDVVSTIESAVDKVGMVRRYTEIFQIHFSDVMDDDNLCLVTYMYDRILLLLYESNCTDSDLVVDFIHSLDFHQWFLERENPILLRYVLKHMQIKRHDIRDYSPMAPVFHCFQNSFYGNVRPLLEYGIDPDLDVFDFEAFGVLETKLRAVLGIGMISERRAYLLSIFCLVYRNRTRDGIHEAHTVFWRTVPDPYPTCPEICVIFRGSFRQSRLNRMGEMAASLSDEGTEHIMSKGTPRSLRHLSRTVVRDCLNLNYQLPGGIWHLDIPKHLKHYLNLEI